MKKSKARSVILCTGVYVIVTVKGMCMITPLQPDDFLWCTDTSIDTIGIGNAKLQIPPVQIQESSSL